MKFNLILSLLFFSLNSTAYVMAKTETGVSLKWKNNQDKIPLFINTKYMKKNIILDVDDLTITNLSNESYEINLENYLKRRIQEVLESSIDEWNTKSELKINPYFDERSFGKNTFSFSDNANEFGSGVIAVTKLGYDPKTGDILDGEILINQSFSNSVNFTLDKKKSSDSNAFLGDVITHELGHFLGLSHSEVIDSSMIFSVFKGQHKIHSDDIAGIKELYSTSQGGSLNGVVNSGGYPVFGVNVQAISLKSNTVVQGVISDVDGNFSLKNLPLDESFYILTSPLKNKESLANYYKDIRTELCSSQNFEPTFFSKCGGREKGKPQAFLLNKSHESIDVGNITIRCRENIDIDYYAKKFETTNREHELVDIHDYNFFAFSGLFNENEIKEGVQGQGDEFVLDFTHLELTDMSLSNLQLELNISGTTFGSSMGFIAYFKRDDESTWSQWNSSIDTNLDKLIPVINIKVNLSTSKSDNLFRLKVYPTELSRAQEFEIFSAPTVLKNSTNIYSITGQVQYSDGSILSSPSSYPYDDNASCNEGSSTYKAEPYISQDFINDTVLGASEENIGVGCGTIDIDSDSNSSGMGSMLIGFLLTFFLAQIAFKPTNFLS